MQKKKFNPWRFVGTGLAALLMIPAFSGSANADGPSLVDILEAKGVLTQGEARVAKAEAKAKHKHLYVGGRIQADAVFYRDDPGLDMADGQEFRRARLFAAGSFGDWHFKAQYDFAGNKATAKDVYIKYEGLRNTTFKVGQFKEPFGLTELTSSRFITFMERALPDAFAPSRHMGAGIHGYGDFWSADAGVFGGKASGPSRGVDSNLDVTGRVTVAPFHERGRVLHLGAAISYQLPDSNRKVRFDDRPESHVTSYRLVDTGYIPNVGKFISYDLEGAAVYGPLSIQGEYAGTNVYLQDGNPNPSFSGFYVYASWFVTGESRPYSVKKGVFERIHPNHNFQLGGNGWGALELAARFSQLDLEDALVAGGKEQDVTVGVNWYPRPHLRFTFNWVHASVDRSPLRAAHPLMALNNFNPDAYQMRAQIDF